MTAPIPGHAWLCKCGDEEFDEPEDVLRHISAGRNSGDPKGTHGQRGFFNLDTGERVLPWGFDIFKGAWKLKVVDLDNPLPVLTGAAAAHRTAETPLEEEQAESDPGEGIRPVSGERKPTKAEARRAKKNEAQLTVQMKPQSYLVDESVLHLHHLFISSARGQGLNYTGTLGEFIRDVTFHYFLEHPELIDLTTMLTPENYQAVAAAMAQQEEAVVA